MKRILVAVDGSSPSLRAVDLAADLAAKYRAELLLVNVMPAQAAFDPTLRDFARSEGLEGSPYAVFQAFGNKALSDAQTHANDAGVSQVTSEIASGEPADVILGAARERSIDLIVLGRRGRGQLSALLLGSVSQKVANAAPCPVLIVR
jgi:nucleotide-binding universal stress UspA family protein